MFVSLDGGFVSYCALFVNFRKLISSTSEPPSTIISIFYESIADPQNVTVYTCKMIIRTYPKTLQRYILKLFFQARACFRRRICGGKYLFIGYPVDFIT